ncbi:MAG: hypothetical protein Q9186_006891 [Xanthomendoza sp. 1 TL-2023]
MKNCNQAEDEVTHRHLHPWNRIEERPFWTGNKPRFWQRSKRPQRSAPKSRPIPGLQLPAQSHGEQPATSAQPVDLGDRPEGGVHYELPGHEQGKQVLYPPQPGTRNVGDNPDFKKNLRSN